MITIREIIADETHVLRQQVLRPNQRPEDQVYQNDDAPDALHAGAFDADKLIGIATVFREPLPGNTDPRVWRLRGMAVSPEKQKHGIGRRLIEFCVAHIRAHDGNVLWCKGRTLARAFYESLGFRATGAEFDVPISGPHFIFWREC